jgi:phosphoribosyl-ATP pyrophosphohydrolase/phosphoribosyl-AMP cyclohydrolase
VDCDRDTLVIAVMPDGPACHTGERSCFFSRLPDLVESCEEQTRTTESHGGVLDRVYDTILDRKRSPAAESYVASLFKAGQDQILKKVTEESGEVILASKGGTRDQIVHESADLLFHLLVALGYHEIPPSEIYQELARRFGRSGIEEKESRER